MAQGAGGDVMRPFVVTVRCFADVPSGYDVVWGRYGKGVKEEWVCVWTPLAWLYLRWQRLRIRWFY